jgi:hypothetical protein
MDKERYSVFVDDLRNAPDTIWRTARNYDEAVSLLRNGDVYILCLDHDLGKGKSGYDVAKIIIEESLWPEVIYSQSMNPVGRKNILSMLRRYAPEGVRIIG